MADVTVIGLGHMGAAIAKAFAASGRSVIVWNRTAERAAALESDGVAVAVSLEAAMAGSPVVVVCLSTYETTRAVLDPVAATLSGRTVVQVTSGRPAEAEAMAAWIRAHGALYLDAAILSLPEGLGTSHATVLCAGDRAAMAQAGPLLTALAPDNMRDLGEPVHAAKALDLAWLSVFYGLFAGAAHAATICASEGLHLEDLIALHSGDPALQRQLAVVRDGAFDDPSASLAVWGQALRHIQLQGRDVSINTEVPDFFASLFERAEAAGYGATHVMSLVKILGPMGAEP